MKTYYVTESNSGGYYTTLKKFGQHAIIKAENSKEAISKFENHFDLCWLEQNSFGGNSCNCCGRRFTLHSPDPQEEDWDMPHIWHYDEKPYFVGEYEEIHIK